RCSHSESTTVIEWGGSWRSSCLLLRGVLFRHLVGALVAGGLEVHVVEGGFLHVVALGRDARTIGRAGYRLQRGDAVAAFGKRQLHHGSASNCGRPLERGPCYLGILCRTEGETQLGLTNSRFELGGGALGDGSSRVDEGNPVGEGIGLIQVLSGQQRR